jgi:vacuolar iron transporter family protein
VRRYRAWKGFTNVAPVDTHAEHPVRPQVHHHRNIASGGARAAIFGVSDGLVTNVALVLGIAGASPGGTIVRLAGISGLIAGSFSMAGGEFLSMTAQRELIQRELDLEQRSISRSPEGETNELRRMYEQQGVDPKVAHDMAKEVMADPDLALETHVRMEMGISTDNLGSPVQAALASFVTFAIGAFIPLFPWLYSKGNPALVASFVLGAVAALVVGVVLAAFTERPMLKSALRQFVVTAIAAGVTYGVGRAIGAGVH